MAVLSAGERVGRSASLLALLILTSCTTTEGPDVDPLADLQSRPSAADAVATYTAMQADVRAAVTAVDGRVVWKLEQPTATAGCGEPFDGLGGETTALETWSADGGIPDDSWPAAADAARAAAARSGLTETTTVVDQPGRHQIRFTNSADGTYATLGTEVNAVLAGFTGCFLTETGPPATR